MRNVLNVHKSDVQSLQGSNTLDLAVTGRLLYAVDRHSIHRFAYPCCTPGGQCCPYRPERSRSGSLVTVASCCAHSRVHTWLVATMRHHGAATGTGDHPRDPADAFFESSTIRGDAQDIQHLTRISWYDSKWHRFSAAPQLMALQRQEMNKNWSAADIGFAPGMSYNHEPKLVDGVLV